MYAVLASFHFVATGTGHVCIITPSSCPLTIVSPPHTHAYKHTHTHTHTHTGLFDRNGDGTIDVGEFQQLWQYINQWKVVFDRYDKDRSGNIDANELCTAYKEMGFRVSMSFCQLVVIRFDRLAKKSLKFDDFIQSCVMLRSLTDAFRTRDTNINGIIQVSYEDFMTMAISNKP